MMWTDEKGRAPRSDEMYWYVEKISQLDREDPECMFEAR